MFVTSDAIAMLESAGAGGIVGFIAGYAIKKVLRIGIIIVGLFFACIMVLTQRQIISVNWDKLSNQTQAIAQQGLDYINSTVTSTASQFHHHSSNLATVGIPVADGSLFIAGFIGGLA